TSKTKLRMTKLLPRSWRGVRRLLCPKMTSLAGEETGVEPPAQLKGLLQLAFAGDGKADAPVHVAAKQGAERSSATVNAAASHVLFNTAPSVTPPLFARSQHPG